MTQNTVTYFLNDTDWSNTTIDWFDADWSVRRYARLTREDGKTAILLNSPPDDSPDAMVGHSIGEWSKVNALFKSLELNVPTIIKQDLSIALILMEDFGTDTIANKGVDAYLKAANVLVQMRDHPQALSSNNLIKYEDTHVYQALRFYPQYVSGGDVTEWFEAWNRVENSLPPSPRALTHIDFHPANLMWHNNEIGIIDFQAACDGPFVYDIVNLLEDIRLDVAQDIKHACRKHYCALLSPNDRAIFDQWYDVITAQFYARILGQIKYLAKEKGRDDLMKYYDAVSQRFDKIITNKTLTPIARFIEKER